jgi:hypothetical protein
MVGAIHRKFNSVARGYIPAIDRFLEKDKQAMPDGKHELKQNKLV